MSKSHFLLIKNSIFILIIFAGLQARAKEGMWIPATLKAHEKDMKAMGLEIPIEQLYNENGTGLNNAVVLFGKGCTGEIISTKGLILTNHHCGYGSAQGLSNTEHDYFANGFWAKNQGEELPCKGLTVTFIRRMENVTDRVLAGISDTLNDITRDSIVTLHISAIEKDFMKSTGMDASIKPYFKGNQYWVAITQTYKDIRFVGFPPNSIGAFGGDVENWMWPRHTGDFSIFRVYAGADNKPAEYATTNKPYNATEFFHINISGYKEGDFSMVYGFPGTTDEYISSYALKQVYSIADPISIAARTRKLNVWTEHMSLQRETFLKYTSKRAGVANGWKKWQGEVEGLKINNATSKKQAFEKSFQEWANADKTAPYADNILSQMRTAAEGVDPLLINDQYNKEAVLGIELIQQGASLEGVLKCFRLNLPETALRDTLQKVMKGMEGFTKNYDAATDKDVFISLMSLYFSKCAATLPDYFKAQYAAHKEDIIAWGYDIYNTSILTSQDKLNAFAASAGTGDSTKIINDPAWQLYYAINTMRKDKILPVLNDYYARMRYLNRLYLKAQMMKDKNKIFYPDANLTQRVTFGQIKGLKQGKKYSYQTTLGEVIALEDSTSDIFRVPKKLKDLYAAKDYGRWGVNGTMPLAFIASNHTSGGNSGSPVLNSRGELIGTNFDRAYEGTMSDYYFDPNRCRNISVDIRYTLFIIEKFGGAGWLIDEMSITGTQKKAKK
ncbi:MAG: serine protease [Flavipsychrobacter sp.]|nr:serine protease [Flavipsychrobacter sp.]